MAALAPMTPPADSETTVHALNPQVLSHIFSFLGFQDCAAVACVQQSWRTLVDDDLIWKVLCQRDYHVNESEDWSGRQIAGFKKVYQSWYLGFGRNRYGALLPRAKRCWDVILEWTRQHAPEIAATIAPGVSEEVLDEVETKLGAPLPLAVRVVYRLRNGQLAESRLGTASLEKLENLFKGLFGGYSFYEHIVSTRLVKAHEIVQVKGQWRELKLARFAQSFNQEKYFAVSLMDGQVYTGTRSGHHLCCCPPISSQGGSTGRGNASDGGEGSKAPGDGMLVWLEEYARRLQAGWYRVKKLWDEDFSRGISLYPEAGPSMSEVVTRGVLVRSSALFIPEHSQAHPRYPSMNRFFFSYSIRLSYCPPEEVAGGNAPQTVQLRSRRWVIRQDEEVVDEVRGEGVIGKYPLLEPGQPEFVYQSCTSSTSTAGSMEGSLQFVPGSLLKPTGQFDAKVERFPLESPDFIF